MKYFKLLLILFLITGCSNQTTMQTKKVKINDQILTVEVAETLGQMALGLSGRKSLTKNQGMLFAYPNYQARNFHMKEMNFPLDFIWIKDDVIVGLTENLAVLSPNGQINKIKSPSNVNLVLEVNSGWISQNNVKVGDKVISLD